MRSVVLRAAALVAALRILGVAAPSRGEDLAFVANFRSGTLSIVETDRDAVPATVPLAAEGNPLVQQVPGANPEGAVAGLAIGGPVAVALSDDGATAYVVQSGSPGSLIVLDTVRRSVLATVPLGAEPFALAITPEGDQIYVANFAADTVSVIDARDRREIATLNVGDGPSSVAIGGRSAYVANMEAGTISIIDLETRATTGTIEAGKGPVGLAWSRDLLWVANSGDNTVSVLRTEDRHQRVATIPVGRAPTTIALDRDGAHAFVGNQGDNTVSVIDAGTNQVTATLSVGREPFGLALTRDGAHLVVANRASNSVSIVEVETQRTLRTVPVGTSPLGVATGRAPAGDACHCALRPRHAPALSFAAAALPPLLLFGARARRRRRDRARSQSV